MKILAAAGAVVAVVVAIVVFSQVGKNTSTEPVSVTTLTVDASATASVETSTPVAAAPTTREQAEAAKSDTSEDEDSGSSSSGSSSSSSSKKKSSSSSSSSDDDDGTGNSAGDDTPSYTPVADLTLAQRQDCYLQLVAAEDRAVSEAEAKYPLDGSVDNTEKNLELRFSLTEKYQAEVAAEFGISTDDIPTILAEGIDNQWPLPPLSE